MSHIEEQPILDENIINNIKKLQRPGMPNLIHRIIDIFVSESVDKNNAIDQAFQAGSGEELAFITHALKSSSGNLGALRLSQLCSELEQAGKAGDISQLGSRIQLFKEEYQKAQDALLKIRENC